MQAALLRQKRRAPAGRLSPQLAASGRLSPQFLTTSASEPDLPPLGSPSRSPLSQTRPLHPQRLSSSRSIPSLDAARAGISALTGQAFAPTPRPSSSVGSPRRPRTALSIHGVDGRADAVTASAAHYAQLDASEQERYVRVQHDSPTEASRRRVCIIELLLDSRPRGLVLP